MTDADVDNADCGSNWDAAGFRERLEAHLSRFVAAQGTAFAELGDDAALLVDAAAAAVGGGKRFRALFCVQGFRAVREPGGHESEQVLAAAAALELLHASALVHDDLMDASDTRRGRPSVHRAFEARHREAGWRGGPEQYGAAAAVLLGDLLLSWADERLRTCGLPHVDVLRALRFFDTTRSEVILGQFLDVSVQARGDADVEQSMRVLRYKSAKYSVERPLHVGAALAGGSGETIAALTAYGVPLGEAFQLRDDLLGVFGDPAVTGKPAGDDLTEGKRTVLVALALASAAPQDAALLDRSLGTALTEDDVRHLRKVIDASGATAQVEQSITDLTTQALAALEDTAISKEVRPMLRTLAAAATQRAQ